MRIIQNSCPVLPATFFKARYELMFIFWSVKNSYF